LTFFDRGVGTGVLADSSCILVLPLQQVAANAQVLAHLMKCIVRSPLSEPQLVFPEVWLLKRHPELVGRRKVEWDVLRFVGRNPVWLGLCIPLPGDARFRHTPLLTLDPV
jgi:hypothetical protein